MALPNLSVTLSDSETYVVHALVDNQDLTLVEFTTSTAAFDFIRATSNYMLLYDIFEDVHVLLHDGKEIAREFNALFALMVVVDKHGPDSQTAPALHEHPDALVDLIESDTQPVPYMPINLDIAAGAQCFNCGNALHNAHPDDTQETTHV